MERCVTGTVIDKKDTIFHYTKISVTIEHILYEKRLKFSKGINTNDPREYGPWDLEPHLDGNYTQEEYRQEWLAAEKSFRKAIERYKYACFCLNDPPRKEKARLSGYDHLRMWAQYGENFYGVCIAFSANSLQERLKKKAICYTAKSVDYKTDLKLNDSAISDADANEFMSSNKEEWAAGYIQDHLDQIFFLKHVDYRDENEYRILVHDPNNVFDYLDISGCIKAVLLGDRTAQAYHQIVKSFCNQMNTECKQLIWQRGRLRLRDV